ncbi:hypothetical protein CapIbe_000474 [Capra ibex]
MELKETMGLPTTLLEKPKNTTTLLNKPSLYKVKLTPSTGYWQHFTTYSKFPPNITIRQKRDTRHSAKKSTEHVTYLQHQRESCNDHSNQ